MRVIALCGRPAAGKSTLSIALCEALHGVRIEFDDYDTEVWTPEAARRARTLGLKACEDLFSADVDSGRELTLVVDDTFHLRAMRREFTRLCSRFDRVKLAWVFVDVPVSVCEERDLKRDRPLPPGVIAGMTFE